MVPCLLLAAFFFGGSFWRGEQFVFRDAAHFYYPLFHEVARQWAAGEVPLWSPWDGVGMPLAADATSSVFYPAKFLLLGPWGFDHGMRLYVLVHYLIAYAGVYRAARSGHCSRPAASLAAVTFAFGGPLLGYHANVVFLVGTAWLPWALERGWKLLREPRISNAVGLAVCLALMVLGGDPQLAYHTVLMLGLAAVWFVFPLHATDDPWQSSVRLRLGRLGALAGSAALALALAAVQILPSSQWTTRSERAASDRPRNVYELAAAQAEPSQEPVDWSALAGQPPPGSHLRYGYDFSIAPWNWPEAVVAKFSGRMYPRQQRWSSTIPAEGRVWFPSLFMGTLTAGLALLGLFHRPRERIDRWWLTLLLFGALASLGWYGLGWVALEFGHATGWYTADEMPVGSPFGGLYWLLTVLLPEYASFRYPAKWWIIAALGLALLAGRGLDEVPHARAWLIAWLPRFASAAGTVGIALYFAANPLAMHLPKMEPDGLFGPLQAPAGLRDAAVGFLQACFILAMAWAIMKGRNPTRIAWLLVAVVAADLAIGNGWIVATAPQSVWHDAEIAKKLPQPTPADPLPGVYRSRAIDFYPSRFRNESSWDRQVEGLVIDRQTLFPRYHLLQSVRSVPSVVSIMPHDYQSLWQAADTPQSLAQLTDMLGARQRWSRDQQTRLRVNDNPNAWPAAWWQAEVVVRPSSDSAHANAWLDGAQYLLQRMQESLHGERVVVVDDKPKHPTSRQDLDGTQPRVQYARERAGRIVVTLKDPQPGWLVVREYFDAGWRCHVTSADATAPRTEKVYRANQVLMAIPVSSQDTQVVLKYWPREFTWGAVISAAAWLLATGCCISSWRNGITAKSGS